MANLVRVELRQQLEERASVISRPKGAILFRRGDPVSGLFLIRRGQVQLGLGCDSRVFPARILGPGSFVGLPATMSGSPYSLTAEVTEDSELSFVTGSEVIELLSSNPQRGFEVMAILSDEISEIRSAVGGYRTESEWRGGVSEAHKVTT